MSNVGKHLEQYYRVPLYVSGIPFSWSY